MRAAGHISTRPWGPKWRNCLHFEGASQFRVDLDNFVSASTTTPSSSPSAQEQSTDANLASGTHVRVLVVISVKNRSKMLTDCFRGLGAQTLPRDQFEVVVIDNCSTEDLTPVFERARRETGIDIRVERTSTDKGPAPARNRGVALARGSIIAFTDSDCRPDPGWLTAGLAAFDAPEVAMVSGNGPSQARATRDVHVQDLFRHAGGASDLPHVQSVP